MYESVYCGEPLTLKFSPLLSLMDRKNIIASHGDNTVVLCICNDLTVELPYSLYYSGAGGGNIFVDDKIMLVCGEIFVVCKLSLLALCQLN